MIHANCEFLRWGGIVSLFVFVGCSQQRDFSQTIAEKENKEFTISQVESLFAEPTTIDDAKNVLEKRGISCAKRWTQGLERLKDPRTAFDDLAVESFFSDEESAKLAPNAVAYLSCSTKSISCGIFESRQMGFYASCDENKRLRVVGVNSNNISF
jgi:hypothetical protein